LRWPSAAPQPEAAVEPAADCPTLTLATYDSFAVSDGIFKTFTDETCIEVEQVAAGDAGQMVSAAILTIDNPTADVMFGIDNTFLQRGLDAGLFQPHVSPLLDTVDEALQLDPENRVTPIDYGDVCPNYWIEGLPADAPVLLDDLIDPANAGQFVTQNPETSSPGFAFLLATIATYGEDRWEEYWQALVDNDVAITSGWSDAYYGDFVAGGGERAIVTSYASSPAAEVFYAEPAVDAPPTGVMLDACFRSVEFAGILTGTEHPEAAGKLVDFLLSTTFQEDIPLNMFVYPANREAELPEVFVAHAPIAQYALSFGPQYIEENRARWTERWAEIVLG